jgi:hypothetical protein
VNERIDGKSAWLKTQEPRAATGRRDAWSVSYPSAAVGSTRRPIVRGRSDSREKYRMVWGTPSSSTRKSSLFKFVMIAPSLSFDSLAYSAPYVSGPHPHDRHNYIVAGKSS